jgi:transcriptional regulator with XRE-family HTH domain
MVIGDRLRDLRNEKKMSQGDIEHKTGLLRCYISRVENGHTVPAVQTLEKMARALEVPMYKLFLDGKPEVLKLPPADDRDFGAGKNASEVGTQGKKIQALNTRIPAVQPLRLAVTFQRQFDINGRSPRGVDEIDSASLGRNYLSGNATNQDLASSSQRRIVIGRPGGQNGNPGLHL